MRQMRSVTDARRPRGLRPRLAVSGLAGLLAAAVAAGVLVLSAGPGAARPDPSGQAPAPAPAGQAPAAQKLLVPARGALLGAWVRPAHGYTAAGTEQAVRGLEGRLGRKLAIGNLYAAWTVPFPLVVARWELSQGRVPMISWGGTVTSRIAAGAYDNLIRTRARQLKALHGPVLLRWFWEMDGAANRARAVSPASYIAAWRHIHQIFASAGATNVSWVWCPNAFSFATGQAQKYYPGSSYADWIGADGYDWAPVRPHARWRSFAEIFSAFYRWGTQAGKPLMVAEFGVLEGQAGAKAAWFRQAMQQIPVQFPALRAVIYFNSNPQPFDWRVTTSPSALAAFRAFAADPYFAARPFPAKSLQRNAH